jgi:beta-barrel assembly-enhancing protease
MKGDQRWRATLYEGEGENEAKYDVEVTVASAGLFIHARNSEPVFWPYQGTRYQSGGLPRFDRDGQTLIITSKDIVPAIAAVHAEALPLMQEGMVSLREVGLASAAVAIVLAGALVLWFFLIPWISRIGSGAIPVSWEERMGEALSQNFQASDGTCQDAALRDAIAEIVSRIERASPPSPYTFRVTVSRNPMVNAFAGPGGYIVVCRGLVEHAETPEELAGILAHEMEHVYQRHVTGALFREASIVTALGLIAGDTGSMASLAAMLGSLQFRREDESSADSAGMAALLRAKIDPAGMIAFFEKLALSGVDLPGAANFLSTHPATAERIIALEKIASSASASVPLRSRASWPMIRQSCK